MKRDEFRHAVDSLIDSVADGWQRVRESTAGALTRFRPGPATGLPERAQVDDELRLGHLGWGMLGGEVYEDAQRLVVRLELPGLRFDELHIEVRGQTLHVAGEKRFKPEGLISVGTTGTADPLPGRWRVMQCAYGAFERSVPLPVTVSGQQARSSYADGVLRVELPKLPPA